MKAQPKSIFNLLTLFALLISLLGSAAAFSPAHAALPANLPIGLTAADWSQIEAFLPPTQQTYIKASNTGASDEFGISMDISGDTLVVGAIFEDSNATGVNGNQADNSATDSGAAYVFTRNGTTWSQQAYLKASNTNPNDWFGASVAISGDTLVVGAFFEDSNATGINGNQADNSATNSGAAYVFTRSGTTWSQQAYLKASNTDPNDWFGYSAAISGDTLLVGVFKEDSNVIGVDGNQADNSATDSGAVYVFTRNGTNWSQQAYLKASNTEAIDDFGNSVAISGDTLVVGALNESSNAIGVNGNQADNSASYSGAAYVFTRNGTTWSQQAYLKASNTDPNDWFGYSVAISGDTLVVGSRLEDSNATGVNGNETDNSANASGAAYVFTRSGTTWSQQAYLKASNAEAADLLGNSVAISGDTLIVSAYYEDSNATGVNGNQADNSATESGAAYVFTRSGTTWSQQAYLKASNTGSSDNFGWLVAISGDTLVVGAHLEDSNATGMNGNQADNSAAGSGAGYVYLMDTIAPTATSITRASATPTSASSVDFTVSFSEPVTGVDNSDFSLTTTGVSSAAVSGISGSGSVYTVTVNTGVGSGTLRLDVLDNDGITDLSLNPLSAGLTTGETYTISKTPIFTDVPYSYWANSYIERLYTASITGGCVLSPLQYCPDSTVTRAQMAIFLLKGIHGSSYAPPAVNGNTGFSDVAVDYWAAAWIKQLAAEGITSGCGAGIYCPDSTVTRAQMAIFLLKAKNGSSYAPPAVGTSTGFTDVATDYWAAPFIKQLVTDGITSGCGAGNYCPDDSVTRAQMAIFLVRTFNLP